MEKENNLDLFMNENFPELSLQSPLFYKAPVGMRFDLCGEFVLGKREDEEPLERAYSLFKALNKETDRLFVAVFVDAWKEHPFESFQESIVSFFQQYISAEERSELIITEHVPIYDEEDENEDDDLLKVRFCKEVSVKKVKVKGMLEAKINTSYSEEADRLEGDLFIINTTNKTIFHLYDARGLDIVAAEKETLKNLYENYHSWILDYDREKIDQLFNMK